MGVWKGGAVGVFVFLGRGGNIAGGGEMIGLGTRG